jgi:hypothetical protein
MQRRKKAGHFAVAGALVACGIGAAVVLASPAYADTLPAYTANGFCTTHTINAFHNVKEKDCTGQYRVTKSTYKFTQDNLKACPRVGVMVNLDETWVSGPQGGQPTILAHYHVYL